MSDESSLASDRGGREWAWAVKSGEDAVDELVLPLFFPLDTMELFDIDLPLWKTVINLFFIHLRCGYKKMK